MVGEWELDKEASDDQEQLLEGLGVGYVTRNAICAASKTLKITQDKNKWDTEITTAVVTR